jgi:hypothetical protein
MHPGLDETLMRYFEKDESLAEGDGKLGEDADISF